MINLYTNSTIGSYTTGTVTCTKNSANVTGSGTTWSEIVNPGDILTLNDDKLYVIQSVNSNTSLTLDKPFAETTVSNSNYRIFLNTAAHFPSDTAAKVERALEQLSDINEAAINNNRTVTAATKLDGKGLTSTAGIINLNPPTVNSNTGGAINFHYNQSNTTTSSIVESGNNTLNITGNIALQSPYYFTNRVWLKDIGMLIQSSDITRGDITSVVNNNKRLISLHDSDRNIVNCVYASYNVTNDEQFYNAISLYAYSPSTTDYTAAHIDVGYNQNGAYTYAPTPETTDNSTKIATTAFVNNRLPYTTGTFTPTLSGSSTAGVMTYTKRQGIYVKIGKMVFIYGEINGRFTTLPNGSAYVGGMPFRSNNDDQIVGINVYGHSGGVLNSASRLIRGEVYANIMRLHVISSRDRTDQGAGKTDWAKWNTTSTDAYNIYISTERPDVRLLFAGWYMTAS